MNDSDESKSTNPSTRGPATPQTDERTDEEKLREATEYLKQHGVVSLLALICLTTFFFYTNAYVAIGSVVLIAGSARYMETQARREKRIPTKDKAVLITGCDTGFGHELAKQLDSLGVTVFAGCLFSTGEGATSLKGLESPRMQVVQMDVTDQKQIDESLQFVKKKIGNEGLWGLVNNAGLNFMGDIELTTMEQFERVCNINQLGTVRVTKAFLPLIRKAKGRVVNVTSVKGRISCIYDAAYEMTKWAGETFSDILRMEMRKFGVQVCVIEPGNYGGATGCLEMKRLRKDFDTMWQNMSPELRETYGKEYVYHHLKSAEAAIPTACRDLSLVTNAMVDALLTFQPRARYLIGGASHWYDIYKWRALIHPFVPEWFMDGLYIHDARTHPLPESLIGQQDAHSH